MLRVVIADDEIKVIQLIELLVDWRSFNMEIIARATDGQQALDTILREKPDVVVTDIRMPVINGIELVEKAHDSHIFPYFVIVSGYSEFEYAQKGIQLGVEDYLLKPIKKSELESVLDKINRKYTLYVQNSAEKDKLVTQLAESRKKEKKSFLTDVLIKNDYDILELPLEEINKEYNCSFEETYLQCFVTHIFINDINETAESHEQFSFVLPKIAGTEEETLSSCCKEAISICTNDEVITLINYNTAKQDDIYSSLDAVRIAFRNYRSIYPNFRGIIGASKPFRSMKNLDRAFQYAQLMQYKRFRNANDFLLLSNNNPDDRHDSVSSSSITIPNTSRKAILKSLEILDSDGLRHAVSDYFDIMWDAAGNASSVLNTWSSLTEAIAFGVKSLPAVSDSIVSSAEDLPGAISRIYSFECLKETVLKICTDLISDYKEMRKSIEDKPIRDAKKYIQEHYNEAISLETVSREAGFNPAYFSTVFKKSTGENFLDYLKDVRIENAKEMLVHSDLDIPSIASAVGYADIKYFTRLFHKATSLTPNDYRKLYG